MSLEQTAITYTTRVSPELRRLFADRSGAAVPVEPPPVAPVVPAQLPTRRVRLRVDGRRPVVFDGALVLAVTSDVVLPKPPSGGAEAPVARQALKLYRRGEGETAPAMNGALITQISLDIDGVDFARPLYWVGEIASSDDLAHSLARHAPAEAFAVGAHLPPATDAYAAACAETLREDFAALAARAFSLGTDDPPPAAPP